MGVDVKRCVVCKIKFEPRFNSFQKTCEDPECIAEFSRTERGKEHIEKNKRKHDRQRKEELRTRKDWLARTQEDFNRMIRARDFHEPCISCGKPPTNQSNQWDCGHYRSVGACPELRFEELNAHKQCKQCNRPTYGKSGNVVEYRIRLRAKIGDRKLAWLEGPHIMPRWTIDELKAMSAEYKRRTKEYLKQ